MVSKREILDGNGAAAEAMRLGGVKVICAYPVTPQSPLAERLSEMVEDGRIDGKYIRVESEHSAMAATIGAALTGVRAGTATSSVGLALMHEVLGVASGDRVPIVMPVVNRALVAPWSLWCDHSDTMAERDTGWIQIYTENSQEVFDTVLMSYKIAENPEVMTPVMVALDGFFLSHTLQVVELPEQADVDEFIPEYTTSNIYLDPDNPMFINDLTPPEDFTEMKYQQKVGFDKALEVIPQVQAEFAEKFGRKYDMVESFMCDDADVVLVTMGSMSGTAKQVVKDLRQEGKKVGVVKIRLFRPFPVDDIRVILNKFATVGVIDRSAGLGAESAPVMTEVSRALAGENDVKNLVGFVAGLGGRDVTIKTIRKAVDELYELQQGKKQPWKDSKWIDVKENALQIREVNINGN